MKKPFLAVVEASVAVAVAVVVVVMGVIEVGRCSRISG